VHVHSELPPLGSSRSRNVGVPEEDKIGLGQGAEGSDLTRKGGREGGRKGGERVSGRREKQKYGCLRRG